MRWRFGAGQFLTQRFRINFTGRACFLLALGLLVLPAGWVLATIAAAALHELGHLSALWVHGIRVHGLQIDIGGACLETAPMEPGVELICALSGPLAGLLVCLFWRWFPRTALAAGIQTMFNLIPLYPLDGGRALRALRNICCKPMEKGVQ